ncbi:Diaminobutyrate--2-oxoglutarate aminotransferase [Rubrobacter xylanophilus DSM 9941]|uniref:diaminobutyrate--2-oxoglutarate transaminase n=1 Tax=Rubrobacter xylanophilus TaxID=49319 RepID=UPI001C63CC7A|nr:diaminobutyrate--2-oxoglutarate transaminase [Rubrobacter xylanophilus]QYJ16647.1 Diaminobutyrate--2-oxoglutarate aminotransferase [Rubrobacter xylanophilus DSM 9941]
MHTAKTAAFREKGASGKLLGRQAERESNARTYPRNLPIAVSRARGSWVWDADGRRYLDCLSGAGTLALGHNHPVVLEAIREVLDRGGPLHALDLATPVKDRFVGELFRSLPRPFAERAKVHFCGPAGTDAVEAAVKLAKTATGRETVLAFGGGYHGMTHGSLSLTGKLAPKEPIGGLMPGVHFLPYPYGYRCPFGLGGEEGWRVGARYVERLLDDPESGVKRPAAMVLEVVQGEGGSIPAPDGWVREMRRITRERGIPLIVDEIQTGLGRTGTVWAFERPGIEPDAVVMSKAIGGSLPLAVVVYDAALDVWEPGAHTGTFRGNQLAMAAGAATIRHVLENGLHEHAARMGDLLLRRLRELRREAPCIGEVRGRGLMVGVEIVDPEAGPDHLGSRPASPELARRIQAEALRRGLILETGGRHGAVVRLLPPLTVTGEEVEEICGILGEAVLATSREAP